MLYCLNDGELSERFKELVLKTSDGATHREFESHTLRQRITVISLQRNDGYFLPKIGVCKTLVNEITVLFVYICFESLKYSIIVD